MGRHAELAWWDAFKRNDWTLHPSNIRDIGQGVKEYKQRKASVNNDIDFIAEKDGIEYGVEIKNGLSYPDGLFWKYTVAAELQTIPLIIARWLNPAQVPLIKELGGEYIAYKDAIYSTSYSSIIKKTRNLLGAPIEARDKVDDQYFSIKMEAIHKEVISNFRERKKRIRMFLLKDRTNYNIRRTLGDKSG